MSSIRQNLIVFSVIASWALGAFGALRAFRDEAPVEFPARESETPKDASLAVSSNLPRRITEQRNDVERRLSHAEREVAKLQSECESLSKDLQRSRQEVLAARSALEDVEALRSQELPFTKLGTLLLDPANNCGIREHFDHLSQYFPDKVDAARLTQLVVDPRFRSMSSTASRPPTAAEVIEIIGQEAYDRLVPIFEQAPVAPYYRDLPDDAGIQRRHREYFATKGLLSVRRFAPAFVRS